MKGEDMSETSIVMKKEESIATLILNRPNQMNAINEELYDEFLKAISDIGKDDEVKALILTGAGRAFCSGYDFNTRFFRGLRATKNVQQEVRNGVLEASQPMLALRSLAKPVIAAVNGYAIAGGLSLALASDVIVASENAKFSEGHINFASSPDCGSTYFLPRLLGTARAFEFILTGKTIDAREAERIGLVNKVVPPEELESAAKQLAHGVSAAPLGLLKLVKPAIYQGGALDLSSAMQNEATDQSICATMEECREASKRYFEKFKRKQ
jgi:2-(1,2-epoxy-1,2-dihydrophenyl)acetyl-CoA isomerase